jgi:hypothetical protein
MSTLQRAVRAYAESGSSYDRWKMLIAMHDHMRATVDRAKARTADALAKLDFKP